MKISVLLTNNIYLSRIFQAIIYLIVRIIRIVRKSFSSSTSDRTIVIAFLKLGDTVFSIPALREILRNSRKDLYIFCLSESAPIYERFFDNSTLITFNDEDFYFDRRMVKSIIRKKLTELNPERIYDFTGSTISASLLFNAKARHITGMSEIYYKSIYTQFLPYRKIPHLMDMYLDIVRTENSQISNDIKKFDINFNKDDYILIHPHAGWKAKEWDLRKFIQLAAKLNKKYRIIILAETGKIQKEIKDELDALSLQIIETGEISELMNVINDCSVIISNDSGPLYIAGMLGKPTFTIFGPTNPAYSLPYGDNNEFIQKSISCSPEVNKQYCFTNAGRRGCPSFECMRLLEVDEVYRKVENFLTRLNIGPIDNSDTLTIN